MLKLPFLALCIINVIFLKLPFWLYALLILLTVTISLFLFLLLLRAFNIQLVQNF